MIRKRFCVSVVIAAMALATVGAFAQNAPATAPASAPAASPAAAPAVGRGARGPGGQAARGGRGGGRGAPAPLSPEVRADKTITIRLRSANAQSVTLTGDINSSIAIAGNTGNANAPAIQLTKDDAGVWSYTSPPMAPGIYNYALNIDGVRIADPNNPDIKGTSESMATVPGDTPLPWEIRTVPHGHLTQVLYDSKAVGMQRRFHVYTPPGYEAGTDKLPVLYLLHGYTDDDSSWTQSGKAHLIMDNLIADGKSKPAIIVMPYGQLSSRTTQGDAIGGPFQQQYENQILNEIIPYVEKNYRVVADVKHRALAGLSMGGQETAAIGMNHPEVFGSIGMWSAAGTGQPVTLFAALAAKPDNVKHGFQYIHIGVGEQDNLLAGSRTMDQWLTEQGIQHEFTPITGVHSWLVWRVYLSQFLPKFTEAAAK